MGSEPGYETAGSKDLTCEDWMVNIRTDADLSAAVQNALQTLLPQIRTEIREEFCTSSGPSDAGGNPPPVIIHTWLERFNKQKPRSFEKAIAPVDAENWISHMEKIFDHFLRLAGFLGAAAGIEEEQAKNFQWGLRRSTLNHLMCMSYTDVAQVANTARNYEILHERDDDDAERPDKRQKSGDRHQPTTQRSSHRNHDHNNDRHGSDRRGGSDNHCSSNNNYSGNNNRNSGNGRDQRNRGQQSNRSANSGSQQSMGPSEGYSYPVCTTCGRRHLGECHRAAGTCFKCGQAGHLQKDCKKNTTAS
nr:hypothetical protein [Tanacetum cinerariifolium]